MLSKSLTRALAATLAVATSLLSAPAAAAPVSVRAFAKETLQLATIAYRIGTETAADCPDPQNITGLVMHDLSSYDRRVRPAISRAFSLGAGIGVLEVVPGSAAERAGLRTDDEILSVNGVRVRDPAAVDEPRKSSRRLETFSRDLQATLSNGPAELEIRRRGAVVRTSLTGELGCGGDLLLSDSRERNAWSDGSHVVVTTAMMRLARSDDELAFVVAHEMAHNILGHSSSSKRGIFGVRLGGKREEVAADYMAVWMMTEGGYKAEGGLSFLRTVRRRLWWNVSLDHPSFGRRIRTVSGAIAMAANSPLWARAHHDLAATAKGSDQLRDALAPIVTASAPSSPLVVAADRPRAGEASVRDDRRGQVEEISAIDAPAVRNHTGDRLDAGLFIVGDRAVSGALAAGPPGVAAPATIVTDAQAIASDVAALGIVRGTAGPPEIAVVVADGQAAADLYPVATAPAAGQPCVLSPDIVLRSS